MHSSHLGRSFHFAAGETIYTGQSQKYTSAIVQALALGSGFGPAGLRLDEAGWYGLGFRWFARSSGYLTSPFKLCSAILNRRSSATSCSR
ncbi:MAG: L-histidine N(alpha)-methyltransferase [Ottowia sp.]|nr:L-histidine N(alpha)-methyltransferase [Ottowia sp.]